jgi:hypothetical protein
MSNQLILGVKKWNDNYYTMNLLISGAQVNVKAKNDDS